MFHSADLGSESGRSPCELPACPRVQPDRRTVAGGALLIESHARRDSASA